MAQGSSLPPLKKNESKYLIAALLVLLAAGGLWYFFGGDDAASKAEVSPPVPAPTAREQFTPEIAIPEEDAGSDEEDTPVAERERPSRRELDCEGTLQPAQIRDVINGQPRKQVQTCYERRLKDDNLLQGSMTVLLTIGASGSVRAVSVSGSLKDAQVFTCVKRVARTWKFPRPEGGCVLTSVPFTMTPKL